jgi:ribosomal peptide maturation radical SAM protein 1
MNYPESPAPSTPEQAPVVLIAPLFDLYATPSLGVSILKASLARSGIGCKVLYPSAILLQEIGLELWEDLSVGRTNTLIFECLFAPLAHEGRPPLSADLFNGNEIPAYLRDFYRAMGPAGQNLTQAMLDKALAGCRRCVERITAAVALLQPRIVGLSNTYQGANGAIALVRAIKRVLPGTICVVGGSNCLGEMGRALAEGVPEVDYVFQGEADVAFPAFCRDILIRGTQPGVKLIACETPRDLDAVSRPDYSDFFADHAVSPRRVTLTFESSRGCWWGHRRRCKFCGEPGVSNAYRFKSPERMLEELEELKGEHPEVEVFFAADAIMPYQYYDTFLAGLAAKGFSGSFVYETHANLSTGQVAQMRKAGIIRIQPGIESLSSRLLQLLGKGTDAVTNIRLLRDCRGKGIHPVWLLLVGIPHDRAADYEEQARIIPFIRHLAPPMISPVNLQRGSPYYEESGRHGITGLRPLPPYAYAFPAPLDINRLACFFHGRFASESRERPEALAPLTQEILLWQESWRKETPPQLSLSPALDDAWLLVDTRTGDGEGPQVIDAGDYELLQRCREGLAASSLSGDSRVARLRERGLLVAVDDVLLSVACETDEGD